MKKRFAEDRQYQLAFFEKLAGKCRDDMPILLRLSELYLDNNKPGEALQVAVRAAILYPNCPCLHYVLACAFAISNQPQFALDHLKLAINLGYDDMRRIEKDQNLQPIRHLAAFRAILSSMQNGEA
jgi:predicted Zn-dependent protease